MSIATALEAFQKAVVQCENLISNAHKIDESGNSYLPELDRRQITAAAFLNMFISWETYLESVLAYLLSGSLPLKSPAPTKFASPPTPEMAKKMIIGTMRYFDYGNHFTFKKIVEIYFDGGKPFKAPLDAINSSLDDLRVMRNSAAHISSTTQSALDALALRLLGVPSSGIDLYDLLTSTDPNASSNGTIFKTYRDILWTTAEIIADG